jgi:hypothetical protein
VLGNASYLRPCRGHPVKNGVRLAVYAANIARAPSGCWWIVSDRTQAPSGMGYTLENRMVLSRIFPSIFRETRIARLGGFFDRSRSALARLVAEILHEEPEPRLGPYELLLETLDALVNYRQKHATLRAASVLDLVLCDESNPRSLAAQLASSMQHLRLLPRESTDRYKLPEERGLLKGLSDVRLLDAAEAIAPLGRAQAARTLAQVEQLLACCSEFITLRFFTHLRTSSLGRDSASTELPGAI